MPTLTQTVAGAGQFTGVAGAGLFSFSFISQIPLTSQIAVSRIGYHAVAGGNVGTEVSFFWENPQDGTLMLAGRALNSVIVAPDTSGDYVVCGGLVPRTFSGTLWQLKCYSSGKTVNATITVDFRVVPMPNSNATDSFA